MDAIMWHDQPENRVLLDDLQKLGLDDAGSKHVLVEYDRCGLPLAMLHAHIYAECGHEYALDAAEFTQRMRTLHLTEDTICQCIEWANEAWMHETMASVLCRFLAFTSAPSLTMIPTIKAVAQAEQLWYHTTSWQSAINIRDNGIDLGLAPQSAFGRAFYLNDAFPPVRAGTAIMIYVFNPKDMKRGRKFQGEEWSEFVSICIRTPNKRPNLNWAYGKMVSNQRDCKLGSRPQKGQMMQLGILTQSACQKVDAHLLGIIFFKAEKEKQ